MSLKPCRASGEPFTERLKNSKGSLCNRRIMAASRRFGLPERFVLANDRYVETACQISIPVRYGRHHGGLSSLASFSSVAQSADFLDQAFDTDADFKFPTDEFSTALRQLQR